MKTPPRPRTFIRLAPRSKVDDLVAEARRVGYTVKTSSSKGNEFSFTATDPDYANALVFRAITPGNGVWAITYPLDYWEEPAPVLPATPPNWQKHITAHP